jgi:ABC-type spermidine/putrescine transport system permease subunit I
MLARSFAVAGIVTLICPLCGFPLAFWLARLESRWLPLLLLLVSAPLWISAVVRSFSWMVLFFHNGALPSLLHGLGLVGPDFQLMGTLAGVVIVLAQVLLPLMIITLYGVIRMIDPRLEEAALNLGAAPLQAVWLVTMRLSAGGILAGSLLVFALAVGAFATPSLIGGAKAQLMAVAIQEQTLELLDWPFAAAMAGILLVVSTAIALLYGRLMSRNARP